ncbi:uncharacterized protein VTP21DRAFT_3971 [Calcarisporiella thermophila]|uniref:uncharacterized protein n=1 Tax=Calcarisporiella thermophila TaxID=911321 RepID=UPI0037438DA5
MSTDRPTKRARKAAIIEHTATCNDIECQGCSTGELEFTFTTEDGVVTKPSALDLFHMAMEESSLSKASSGSEIDNKDIAKRLYDLAIEAFEKDSERDDFSYATCLLEFGRFWHVEESVREAITLFDKLVKKGDTNAHIGAGKAKVALCEILRRRNQMADEDSSDEDLDNDRIAVTGEEKRLFKEAAESLDIGLNNLKMQNKEKYARNTTLIAKELVAYGSSVEISSFNRDYAKSVFEKARHYLEQYENIDKETDKNEDAFILELWGSYYFYTARLEDTDDQCMFLLNKAIDRLEQMRKVEGEIASSLEILGHAYLLKSSSVQNDDESLEAYDHAIDVLSKASALNPTNQELKTLLLTLTT